jgi:PTS system mannose-specific IID component
MHFSSYSKVFFRSFFIQGAWNFTGMQNLGLCFTLSPVMRDVAKTKKERAEMLHRHLEFFNTHPYMASPIIGALIKIEEEEKTISGAEKVREVKWMLSGPFAAIGDMFFWSTLKPLSSFAAITAAFLGSVFAPIIFIIIFNTFHLWMRARGLSEGLRHGVGVVEFIRKLGLPLISQRLKLFLMILVGCLTAGLVYFGIAENTSPVIDVVKFFSIVPVFLVVFLTKRGIPVIFSVYIFVLLTVIGFLLYG